jgi:hypothetical protein
MSIRRAIEIDQSLFGSAHTEVAVDLNFLAQLYVQMVRLSIRAFQNQQQKFLCRIVIS